MRVNSRGDFTMCVKDVVIQNQVGLHARPATFFIQKANEYKSSIWVEKDERKVKRKRYNYRSLGDEWCNS